MAKSSSSKVIFLHFFCFLVEKLKKQAVNEALGLSERILDFV
jgi:hypothetical protein